MCVFVCICTTQIYIYIYYYSNRQISHTHTPSYSQKTMLFDSNVLQKPKTDEREICWRWHQKKIFRTFPRLYIVTPYMDLVDVPMETSKITVYLGISSPERWHPMDPSWSKSHPLSLGGALAGKLQKKVLIFWICWSRGMQKNHLKCDRGKIVWNC